MESQYAPQPHNTARAEAILRQLAVELVGPEAEIVQDSPFSPLGLA